MREMSGFLFLLLTLCACSQEDGAVEDDDSWAGTYTTTIANVDGNDEITHLHVISLLASHGIDCSMGGSIVHGVWVPAKDADRSLKILENDLAKRHYWIILYDGKKERRFEIPEKLWISNRLNRKYADLIQDQQYAETTDLGAVLRCPAVKKAVLTFPYVAEVKTLAREYLDDKGILRTGHEVTLELAVSLDEKIGGWRFHFQVWDEGKSITSSGGKEWWQGYANKQKYDKRNDAPD